MRKKSPPSRLVRVSDRLYCRLKELAEKQQTTIKAVLDQLLAKKLNRFFACESSTCSKKEKP